jgi:hypothetical protein
MRRTATSQVPNCGKKTKLLGKETAFPIGNLILLATFGSVLHLTFHEPGSSLNSCQDLGERDLLPASRTNVKVEKSVHEENGGHEEQMHGSSE